MSWPQPREGITGTARDDGLLSLSEDAIARRDLIITVTRFFRQAILVGNPAPVVAQLYQRSNHPQSGDLVVETTRALHGRGDRYADDRLFGFGVLLARREEWAATDAEWAAFCERERAVSTDPGTLTLIVSQENRTTDEAIYIQYGPDPASVARWVNADIMAVPADDWRTF